METSTLDKELSAWCTSYVTAFSAYDADGIGAHWAFPALIIIGNRRISFKSADHFLANTEMLLGFYKRQGVAKAERQLISSMPMTDEVAAMVVKDRMVDARGAGIVTWQAAYMLQKSGGDWRAVSAVADGETDAWNARGTPLGS